MKTKNIQHSSKTKKFPIFGILKKPASHRQKPENIIHNEGKNQSIETDLLMRDIGLTDKYSKIPILSILNMYLRIS